MCCFEPLRGLARRREELAATLARLQTDIDDATQTERALHRKIETLAAARGPLACRIETLAADARAAERAALEVAQCRRCREVERRYECKICLDERVQVVFVPCGHCACCVACGGDRKVCPICNAAVDATTFIYM